LPPDGYAQRFAGKPRFVSGNNFIALVVMILILLFIIMSIGPLISAF
jgi:hypothetical protein